MRAKFTLAESEIKTAILKYLEKKGITVASGRFEVVPGQRDSDTVTFVAEVEIGNAAPVGEPIVSNRGD